MHDVNRKKQKYIQPMDDAPGGGDSTMPSDHTIGLSPEAWFNATYVSEARDFDKVPTEDFDEQRLRSAGAYKSEVDLRGLAYLDYTRP